MDEIIGILDRLDAVFDAMAAEIDRPERILAANEILDRYTGNDLIQQMTEECAYRLGVSLCSVTILNETTQYVIGSSAPVASCLRDHSYCQFVVGTGQTLSIEDSQGSRFLRRMPHYSGVKAYLGVPLLSTGGERLGAFCAISEQPRLWTPQEEALLKAYSANVTLVLDDRDL